jgi:intracellular multiplication protein IcmE
MAQGIKNIKAAFADTKIRGIIIVVVVIALIAFTLGYFYFKRNVAPGAAPGAAVGSLPSITSVPGVGQPSREYTKLQEQQNAELAQEALKKETAALPTLTRVTYLEAGVTGESVGEKKCSAENLAKAHASGVKASELRCLGCSAAALKASGYSAGELRDAGFGANELKDAGFSPADLRNAGFTLAELKNAGFNDQDLARAGVSNRGLSSAKNKTGECSLENLAAAKKRGANATEFKNKNCDAASLRDAGFTAAELKAAGFGAKEFKDAGFTAGDLKNAGFSAKELKDAGFNAKDLRDAGFGAENLKAAGFDAAALKNAGYSNGDLIRAGYAPESVYATAATKGAQGAKDRMAITANAAAATPAGQQVGTVPTSAEGALPSGQQLANLPSMQNEQQPDWQKRLDAARAVQEKQLSAQEYQDRMKQLQQSMSTQANDLVSSWVPIPAQQYVQGTADKAAASGTGAGAGAGTQAAASGEQVNVTTGEAALANSDIFKAGTILFAVLDTGINSDEKSPILCTIVTGDLKGSKLLGNFERLDQKVVLKFSVLNVPYLKQTVGVNLVAIDPNTAKTAIATDVDNHYLLRYGSLLAANFISGFGQAIQDSASTLTVNTGTGETFKFNGGMSAGKAAEAALGQMGSALSQAVQPIFNRPPTVTVAAGSPLGLLIMSDLALPKKVDENPAEAVIPKAPEVPMGEALPTDKIIEQ